MGKGAEAGPEAWKDRLGEYDAVVLAAGSGLLRNGMLGETDIAKLPVDLVRGRSVELCPPASSNGRLDATSLSREAVLCGKYAAPTAEAGVTLIGATHEFKEDLAAKEVATELRGRSYQLAPDAWDKGEVARVTSGYRVQSRRGNLGRMPILGILGGDDLHQNVWLFTGLSSRGLLYHGVYGDILSDAILEGNDGGMMRRCPHLNWWREYGV
eukprot:CAMPEP_0183304992 /NCGR_PEP_ID=MMETSP0160_2-20130417/9881_1 /TAXON_ID=2839 ORGANISM="Odontella Sinensis, Strain Grunow 1884" /NCGR_SAMPLE_ID=MMETSP0160_2 /ASSEMBLY_ACC=CAM_ASM_000250 /LENGTH=211 /DNA_ID=CAMNT_0025468123 /DNA_START=25 /DNA_END=660 /DNA_ORIENTATION=-